LAGLVSLQARGDESLAAEHGEHAAQIVAEHQQGHFAARLVEPRAKEVIPAEPALEAGASLGVASASGSTGSIAAVDSPGALAVCTPLGVVATVGLASLPSTAPARSIINTNSPRSSPALVTAGDDELVLAVDHALHVVAGDLLSVLAQPPGVGVGVRETCVSPSASSCARRRHSGHHWRPGG